MVIQSDHVTFNVFTTGYTLYTYVELDDKQKDEYCREYGSHRSIHNKIENVISLSIRQSKLIEEEFAGLDPRIIQYNDDPGIDDGWDGKISESYLDHSEYTYFKYLQGKIFEVELKGEKYKVCVVLYRDWLEDEEKVNE